MNLIDEITDAYAALQAAETEATEASHRLRKCKLHRKKCDEELGRLIKELKTGESRYPLLERISRNGETAMPGPPPDPGAPAATSPQSAVDPIPRPTLDEIDFATSAQSKPPRQRARGGKG